MMVYDGSLGKVVKFLISVRVCQPGQPETFCIVLNCCCILAATGLPLDCCLLCNRRLGIRISSYLMTLPRQLCTESNYTPLAIEVRVCGPSPELRCLSMARTSRSISPKGTTRNHASLKMGLRRPGARSSNFCGRKPLLTTKKQRGQRHPRPSHQLRLGLRRVHG